MAPAPRKRSHLTIRPTVSNSCRFIMAESSDNGKAKYKYYFKGEEEPVMRFGVRPFELKIRVTKSWLLYDYPTGGDALVNGLHIGALNEVVKDYKSMKERYKHGVKLNVDGYASNKAKDPRYDNRALAKRRATNVVAY